MPVKNFSIWVLLVVAVCSIISCKSPTESTSKPNNASVANPKYGLSFSYDSTLFTYVVEDSVYAVSSMHAADIGLMMFFKNSDMGIISISTFWSISDLSPSALNSLCSASVANTGETYLSSNKANIAGYTASRVYYSYTSSTLGAMKGIFVNVENGGALYLIDCYCTANGFATFESGINAMLNSLTLSTGTIRSTLPKVADTSYPVELIALQETISAILNDPNRHKY